MKFMLLILLIFCYIKTNNASGPFRRMFPKHGNLNISPLENAGDPLFLTPLLEAGKIKVVNFNFFYLLNKLLIKNVLKNIILKCDISSI